MKVNSDAHKEDILKAAMEVFGKEGYAGASTNEIVKNANVSKGLLFHHFKNKETLFNECQLYAMTQFAAFMTKNVDKSETDFFDRILTNLKIKMEFSCKNPEFLTFLNRTWLLEEKDTPFIRAAMEEMSAPQDERMKLFFNGIDTSQFRKNLDLYKIIDYTRIALEASWARFFKRHHNDADAMVKDMGSYLKEAEEIISLFRDGAYK